MEKRAFLLSIKGVGRRIHRDFMVVVNNPALSEEDIIRGYAGKMGVKITDGPFGWFAYGMFEGLKCSVNLQATDGIMEL